MSQLTMGTGLADPNKAFREYRQFLRDTSWYAHAGRNDSGEVAYLALGLAGETGEFVDEVKKIVRESGFESVEAFHTLMSEPEHFEKLVKELGDIMWYITRIMDVMGITRQELLILNTYKLYTRMIERGIAEQHGIDLKWPFTDPLLSYDNVKELIEGEEEDDEAV